MPWQLIFTSAPQGIAPGQSGFCTVARSAELREVLVTRLEQLSSYRHLATSGGSANPLIAAYRLLDIRGAKYHVLTRIRDAGLDFTSRTNHLAHHLVFTPQELPGLPSPALLLRHWVGWRRVWREQPRWLTEADLVQLGQVPRAIPLPAATWAQWAGDAGRAAGLLETAHSQGCFLWSGPGQEEQFLDLYAEALQLLDPEGRNPAATWQLPFTTFLQGEDSVLDFQWRACWPATAAFVAAERASGTPIRLADLRVPDNRLAHIARHGSLPPPAPVLPPHAKTKLRLQPRQGGPGGPAGEADATLPARLSSAGRTFGRLLGRVFGPTGRWVCLAALVVSAAITAAIWWQSGLPDGPQPPDNSGGTLPPSPGATNPGAAPATVRPAGRPPSGARTVRPEPDREASPRGRAAVAALLPDVETHLLLTGGAQPIEWHPRGALTRLLETISREVNPVPVADLEIYRQPLSVVDDWPRLTNAAGRLTCDFNPFARQLTGRALAGQGWSLDFAEWHKAPTEGTVRLQAEAGETLGSCAWFFQPAPYASNAFPVFRLLVIDPAHPPPPAELPIELLRADQTNWLATLREPLRGRLQRWFLPPGAGLRFHPCVPGGEGRGPADLLTQLPEALKPPPGCELDFRSLRERASLERQHREEWEAHRGARIEELQAQLAQSATNGSAWPMGSLAGLSQEHPLYSFPQYLRTQRPTGEQTNQYVTYVRRVLETGTSSNRWNAAVLLGALNLNGPMALREVQPFLAGAMTVRGLAGTEPPGRDFFWRAWSELEARDRARAELRQLQQSLSPEAALPPIPVVPAGLDQLAHVSLMFEHRGGALELIRFPSRGRPQPPVSHDRD